VPAFLPDPATILAFAVAALALAVTPGPDMALFVSRAISYGRAQAFATLAGALTGIGVHTTLVAFGISALIVAAPTAFLVLKLAGALYLLWLAIQALRAGGGVLDTRVRAGTPSLWQSYLTGLGINLTNPKVVLFFITFLPQFVSADDSAATGKLLFLGAEFVVISLPVVIVVVLAAHWLTRTLRDSRWFARALNWSFAAVFASFAAVILTAQARH
jgi:threonine/homoserine/homoserine lactone efflux protein